MKICENWVTLTRAFDDCEARLVALLEMTATCESDSVHRHAGKFDASFESLRERLIMLRAHVAEGEARLDAYDDEAL